MGAKLAENLPKLKNNNSCDNSAYSPDEVMGIYDTWLESITYMIKAVCDDLDIPDLTAAPQTQFNAVLKVIGRKLFANNSDLRTVKPIYNTSPVSSYSGSSVYNTDTLVILLDLLSFLCDRFDKAISIKSFSCLCGVSACEIYNWLNDINASESHINFAKTVKQLREDSLTDILTTAKRNPVAILGVLNKEFNWSMPGVTRETRKTVALDANNLPFLGDSGSRETLPGVVSSSFSPKEKLTTGGEGASGQK